LNTLVLHRARSLKLLISWITLVPRQDGKAFFQHLNFACEVFKYITTLFHVGFGRGFQVRQPGSEKKGAYSTAGIIFLQDID
jgi:hypothetical protein